MKRTVHILTLPLLLLALWLLLNDSLSAGQITLGVLLALTLTGALAASQLRPLRAHPRRLLLAVRLLAHVAWDIAVSNVAVACIIWKGRKADITPGFIRIPLRLRDPHGLAALACIVTYTPGTVWAEYAEAEGVLTLHVLDLKDESAWLRIIQQRYERPLLEIFEP